MMWAAIVVFTSTAECDAFTEAHRLQEQHPAQCILIEQDYAHLETVRRPIPRPLAPFTSPRPRPRPTWR